MTAAVALLFLGAGAAWVLAALAAPLPGGRGGLRLVAGLSSAGGVCSLAGGIVLALLGGDAQLRIGAGGVVGGAVLRLDPLSAPFSALLGLVAVAIAWYAPRYHRAGSGTSVYLLALNLALVASLGVLVAGNVTTFLVAWESMALLCYLLILRHHGEQGVTRAALLFLALSEVGFVLIVAAFAILSAQTGTLDLGVMAGRASTVPAGWRTACFLLALAGFGFKAGLVPFHIWLPEAHPVAPADGSALLSGLIIKLGVFGIALFGVELLPGGPAWWGLVTLSLGALSAVLGILYALMERDLKRFLAFSSIENVGIIVTALGGSFTFSAYGQRSLSALLLLTALYHVVNHGTYKTLLFLEAGVTEHAAGTRNMDRLGGLIRGMPRSAAITLVGTLGIAALPPLNGFVSEWLLFQGLFQGFRIPSHVVGIVIVVAGAVIALTSGLALNAFVRSFGIPFLGMPRTEQAATATERDQPLWGPALLAVACVLLGLGAPVVLVALARVVRTVTGTGILSTLVIGNLTVIPAHTDFSAFSPTYLALCLVLAALVPLAIHAAGRPAASDRRVPVWDGGIMRFRPRMQYTATTHSNPVRVTFDPLYRPSVEVERASDDPAGRSGPVHYRFEVTPLFERYLYAPVIALFTWLARVVRPIQSGDVNLYLFYVFAAVVIAYFAYAR